jgi:hypothetical protein
MTSKFRENELSTFGKSLFRVLKKFCSPSFQGQNDNDNSLGRISDQEGLPEPKGSLGSEIPGGSLIGNVAL